MGIEGNDWEAGQLGIGVAVRAPGEPGGFRGWLACRYRLPKWFGEQSLDELGAMLNHQDLISRTDVDDGAAWCCIFIDPDGRITSYGDDQDLVERVIEADLV